VTMTTYRSTGTSSTTFTFATSTSPPDALARDFDVTAVPLGDYARDPQTNAGSAARSIALWARKGLKHAP